MTAPEVLPSHCHCNRRVRILWSAPLGPDSRPLLLVCGWRPAGGCGLRVPIPQAACDQVGPVQKK